MLKENLPFFQILAEFSRLGPNGKDCCLDDLIYDGLDKYYQAINKLAKGKKTFKDHKEVIEQITLLRTEHTASNRRRKKT